MTVEEETSAVADGDVCEVLRRRHQDTAERLRGLQAQTRSALGAQEFGGGDAADAGTLALEAAEQAMLAEALQDQLNRLQVALGRLDAGTFGRCQRCDQQVPAERLEVMPWATHCVPCQSVVDRKR